MAARQAGRHDRNGQVKILLCHNFYQQSGGEDAAVLALEALLEEKGHRVISFTEDNREIAGYGALQKMAFFPRALFSTKTYRRIRRIAADDKPDIAHVHNVFPLLSPALYVALKRAGITLEQVGCIAVHNTPGLVGALLVLGAVILSEGLIGYCLICAALGLGARED